MEAAAHDEGKKGKRDMVVVAVIQKVGGKCAVEASHLEGPRVLDLTSSGHDHGPRDPERGRKGGLGATVVRVWGGGGGYCWGLGFFIFFSFSRVPRTRAHPLTGYGYSFVALFSYFSL